MTSTYKDDTGRQVIRDWCADRLAAASVVDDQWDVPTRAWPDPDRVITHRTRRPTICRGAGWVLRCECARSSSDVSTWTDPVQWTRVPSASLEDLAHHRVFAPDTDIHADERPEVAAAVKAVWRRAHLDPLDVDDEIRAAVTARRDADARLDAAVAKARRLGRPWAEIGAATGMTRQSANERWKDRT